MKIVVVSPYLPWPLDAGGKVAQYASLACLRTDHRFALVCPVYSEKRMSDAAALQIHFPEIKVRAVYCGSSAQRSHSKTDLLTRSLRWGARQYRRLRYAAPPDAGQQKERPVPAYPFGPLPEPFLVAVADELAQGCDLVQAEFAEMLSLGAWLPTEIPKVFIHHQLHFVYARRFSAARKLGSYSEYLVKVMLVQEQTYLRAFDGVVVFSDEDKHALSGWIEDEKVHVSPFPISGSSGISDKFFQARFSFVGSEEHFPNRDALEWLTEEIWPEISKQVPGSILKVIGQWGEASRTRYSKPGVEFTGYVADLENAIAGSVMLVPLRIGSGIRVKLLDAMAQAVPAVSTSIGCEGLPVSDGIEILIRDDAAKFTSAAVELANDLELRARLATAGKELMARVYSPEQVRKRRNEIYQIVLGVHSQCAS